MKKGFMLIEVIIAVSIIAMLILVISQIISMSIKMNLKAYKMDEEFNIARGVCEMYISDTDTYTGIDSEINIYKYLNNISEIQSINQLIASPNGQYNESNLNEIINSNREYKYTLILKIKRISNSENMEALWVDVINNIGTPTKVSMNAAK